MPRALVQKHRDMGYASTDPWNVATGVNAVHPATPGCVSPHGRSILPGTCVMSLHSSVTCDVRHLRARIFWAILYLASLVFEMTSSAIPCVRMGGRGFCVFWGRLPSSTHGYGIIQ
jgi:hypothetical protein